MNCAAVPEAWQSARPPRLCGRPPQDFASRPPRRRCPSRREQPECVRPPEQRGEALFHFSAASRRRLRVGGQRRHSPPSLPRPQGMGTATARGAHHMTEATVCLTSKPAAPGQECGRRRDSLQGHCSAPHGCERTSRRRRLAPSPPFPPPTAAGERPPPPHAPPPPPDAAAAAPRV